MERHFSSQSKPDKNKQVPQIEVSRNELSEDVTGSSYHILYQNSDDQMVIFWWRGNIHVKIVKFLTLI